MFKNEWVLCDILGMYQTQIAISLINLMIPFSVGIE